METEVLRKIWEDSIFVYGIRGKFYLVGDKKLSVTVCEGTICGAYEKYRGSTDEELLNTHILDSPKTLLESIQLNMVHGDETLDKFEEFEKLCASDGVDLEDLKRQYERISKLREELKND